MSIILSHSGKQHAYQVAKALYELGSLEKFYTSSYVTREWMQQYFLKSGNTWFTRRFTEGLPGKMVEANWRFEIREILYRKVYGKTPRTQNAVYQRDVNFDTYIAKKLLSNQPSTLSTKHVFWGFQGSCHASLQAARQSGMLALCELATAHVAYAKKILGEEQRLLPQWADSIDNLVFPPDYEKRLHEEPHRADKVVAASKFTVDSLIDDGVSTDKIIYLPLGFDATGVKAEIKEPGTREYQKPLKLLYAGTVTQRKGIHYLLEAMEIIPSKDAELHVMGGIQGSGDAFWEKKQLFHYHPPVDQATLFRQYREYDALVLPSVFEGFGLVIVEAMAAGLPVITTTHTMGPEVITPGKNGHIVPIRDSRAIASAIENLCNLTPEELYAMKQAARQAALEYTWDKYRERLAGVMGKVAGCGL